MRKFLSQRGYRYRLHYSKLPGKPDIVFAGKRIAVQVNGCFWHQHGCKNSVIPKSNKDFWLEKLNATVERDRKAADELIGLRWQLFTIWECEIEKDIQTALQPLLLTLDRR